ncbi:hypothetical protein [Nocardia sp. AG03]|uniref:hypothetical protein n=1 Tax=Nocardia sp. AG03 TaxID=3025312 RepID=UPI002418A20B|nr:hypothetical protein [Nocardia sp. AG03]
MFGLSAEWLTHDGILIPTAIVLSHTEQRDRLAATVPAALSRVLIAGDLCFDQLSASLPLRASYRRAYGLPATRKLIVVSSTWAIPSLLGQHPDLPLRLAEALPADEFSIVVAPHPNIVAEHSRWQFREYLAAATRAGVQVIDDIDGWKSAIVAADLVVGDHGSVAFYAAALGIAPLLAVEAGHTVDPASPISGFLTAAPRLDPDDDLATQVRAAITDHHAARYTAATDLTTSYPMAGAAILRTAMYAAMALTEPPHAPEIPTAALPRTPIPGVDSHLVLVNSPRPGTATVTRYPAERLRSGRDLPRGAHLAVDVREPPHRWLRSADIMIGQPGPDTQTWITDTLRALPGCRIATAPHRADEWLLGTDSAVLSVLGPQDACRLFASVAQHHLVRGAALPDLVGEWTIDCGGLTHRVSVRK